MPHFKMHTVRLKNARDTLARDEDYRPEIWIVQM